MRRDSRKLKLDAHPHTFTHTQTHAHTHAHIHKHTHTYKHMTNLREMKFGETQIPNVAHKCLAKWWNGIRLNNIFTITVSSRVGSSIALSISRAEVIWVVKLIFHS